MASQLLFRKVEPLSNAVKQVIRSSNPLLTEESLNQISDARTLEEQGQSWHAHPGELPAAEQNKQPRFLSCP